MAANQPQWPRAWLMTDERIGDRLWEAVDRLPDGAGIIFRHYGLSEPDRLELGLALARRARERKLTFGVAGSRRLAGQLGAALVHNPDAPGEMPCSLAVHDETQALAAREAGAVLAFIAPVYATRSHPDRPPLGVDRAGELAGLVGSPAIALGGMNSPRFDALQKATSAAFHGYAGIDCWLKT